MGSCLVRDGPWTWKGLEGGVLISILTRNPGDPAKSQGFTLNMPSRFDIDQAPGHLIRRAQQIAVAEFARATADHDVTPVQFAFMTAMQGSPGVDQITLANRVAFDAATSGSVIGRLEAKGWVRREADAQDRRRKLLFVTPEGAAALKSMNAAVALAQQNILAPLSEKDQAVFMRLLAQLVAGHEAGTGADKG